MAKLTRKQDAFGQAMWDYLVKERGVPPAQIVLFGRSLGGGSLVRIECGQ